MSKPFPAIPTKLYLPLSALPVTFLIRFSVASQQPSPSSVGILFDPLSSHKSRCLFREKEKRIPYEVWTSIGDDSFGRAVIVTQ